MRGIDRIRKKVIASVGIVAMLSTCLMGCESEKKVDLSPEEGYIIAEDCYGEQVKLLENPEYIASAFATATHIFGLLGVTDRIVAIADGNTREHLLCEMFPEILDARISKGNSAINIEETMKDPKPQVLVMNPESAMEDTIQKQFAKMGVPTLTISFENIQEELDVITLLGDMVDQEEKAQKYVDYNNEIIELVESRIGHLQEDEKVSVYHAINEILRTDKPNSLSAEWMEIAGTHNVAFDIINDDEEFTITSKSYVALEELLQADPECIIINGGDVYDYIMTNERFHNMKAYKNGKVYLIPLGVSRWGHPNSVETCMAILWTASTIYPEYFEDIDMREETKKFYSEIWNYELTEEQVDNILGGRVYKEIKGDGQSGV